MAISQPAGPCDIQPVLSNQATATGPSMNKHLCHEAQAARHARWSLNPSRNSPENLNKNNMFNILLGFYMNKNLKIIPKGDIGP